MLFLCSMAALGVTAGSPSNWMSHTTCARTQAHTGTCTLLGRYPEVPLSPRLSEVEENLGSSMDPMPSGSRASLMGPDPLSPWTHVASGSARLGSSLLPARLQHHQSPLPAGPLHLQLGTEKMLTCYYVCGLPLATGQFPPVCEPQVNLTRCVLGKGWEEMSILSSLFSWS